MSHTRSQLGPDSRSGFPRFRRGEVPASSERTKRDLGVADDAFGEAAPELCGGTLLAGRYLVLRRLGRGGFSDVYLAHDHELDRQVAIKRLLLSSVDPSFIKDEAKTLASLDHPGIVRIYDVCHEPKHGCLVIMQYVPGPLLREVLSKPLSIQRAVEIAIRICGGLIHAHSRGVVHRDIKPTNILMSNQGEPLIADFGLAFTPSAHCEPEGGTPRYMSPEQIRNEVKRIGPSSDIFSTGILLYEMLAGRVPFNGATTDAISQATLEQSPTPINAINPGVPQELDRIVRRALRKNVKDRYRSMEAFQAELIQWSNSQDALAELPATRTAEGDRGQSFDSTFASSAFRSLNQFTHRGLQPFEADDAKFYLSLVPGTKAPSGLPETLQYWKDWIESYDDHEYARVGILYGPSGSGKTSLMRAGIVPHLAPEVLPIYIECRKGQTLPQFASLVARQVTSESCDLSQLLLQVRDDATVRGQHRKTVLLLDQFDNWAGSVSTSQLTKLAAALRHCDGESLQAILIVRDDFWTSVTEFMHLLECGVEQWKNARAIELMDRHHARRLLEAAGRGYGSLPAYPEALDAAQTSFINQAIDEMSDRGRILPIQLAMFAKMAKLQRWHPVTLSQAGGVQGAYLGYFQDLFEGNAAPPSYQRVCNGVVEVLHGLLPSVDQNVHSHQVDFARLEKTLADKKLQNQLHRVLNILVEDLRVVVRVSHPVSKGVLTGEQADAQAIPNAVQCNDRFHLVHDFLTIPIANWVDQVRKSSWRGRALARLDELSAMWSRQKQPRYLPTLPEFLSMQVAAPVGKRSPLQQRFLMRAGRKHLVRALLALAVIGSVSIAANSSWHQRQRSLEAHRRQVVQKVETTIRGEASDYLQLLSNFGKDTAIILEALRPWLDSTDEKLRTRTRLLAATIHKRSFDSLIIDLSKIEPRLCGQVVAVARECGDAVPLLRAVCSDTSAASTEKIRAAITLAAIGHPEPLADMLDDKLKPRETSHYMQLALDWQVAPAVWLELALAKYSNGATYHALCYLGSYPELQLPIDLPWEELARLQLASDPGVSSAAKWLINKTASAQSYVSTGGGPQQRVLSSGISLVRINSNAMMLEKPVVSVVLDKGPALQVSTDKQVHVDEPFWICQAAITNAEIGAFLQEFESASPFGKSKSIVRCSERDHDLEVDSRRAVTGMNSLLILEFCNWLSRREGLEAVYQISATSPSATGSCVPQFDCLEKANGFRLPTLSQVICASGVGATDSYEPQTAIDFYRKAKSEFSDEQPENHFKITRHAKDLMPNRRGVHFDLDAYACWTLENGRIWNFNIIENGLMVYKVADDLPQHVTALWLVSKCVDQSSVASLSPFVGP